MKLLPMPKPGDDQVTLLAKLFTGLFLMLCVYPTLAVIAALALVVALAP